MDEQIGGFMATEHKRNVVTETMYRFVTCKFCGEHETIVKFGKTPAGRQRYLCQKCGRTFMDNQAPEGMQFPVPVMASAINQFYEAVSLRKIARQIKMDYGVAPSHMNIYRWVVRYSQKAAKALADVPVRVGREWIADETVLKLKSRGGENVWFWDAIDDKTKFLLASRLSETRTTKDAQALMERAEQRAGIVPKTIVTDKLRSYLDAVERTWGADTRHVKAGPFVRGKSEDSTRAIERFHGTLKDRTKVMRALGNKRSAGVIMDGWLVHYNFFRPHSGLGSKTPAEVAGARTPFRSWKDVILS
ncbi:MAG: DDE-type integrase/transposase/recombinase [Chloroflexota bacterium]|nr:DDE-type integrase/transposase/recombinase [Chloroflexota bacterium]